MAELTSNRNGCDARHFEQDLGERVEGWLRAQVPVRPGGLPRDAQRVRSAVVATEEAAPAAEAEAEPRLRAWLDAAAQAQARKRAVRPRDGSPGPQASAGRRSARTNHSPDALGSKVAFLPIERIRLWIWVAVE